ncbi:ATP-dependent nuclease [Desulfofundulus thermocisternus]|uniref:ATP-dependent nuclease n=1 Tax=Desulfofundulus thermocisternus TaxID=42471 RepID=UPI00217DDBE5|nr:AAA family ATPase [Desulfofundulus thermocisternus]MCS5694996.1 AAA family ATPase [Desulfofundulus thermocisternus]
MPTIKLNTIGIKNYRNLDGIKVSFDPVINFLVGETNLGKSNLLKLLDTIFNRTSFNEADFSKCKKPIEISLKLTLDDVEIGLFEDLFDPHESKTINIIARQETIDDNIQFFHQESGTNIPPSSVRCLNYIYYDSLRNPANELTFDKRKGVGRFLNHIFNKFIEAEGIEEIDFINRNGMEKILKFINENLSKIKSFQEFSILANLEEDIHNLLARIVTLKDENNLDLHNSGYGVQFLSLICLTILEKLLIISRYKSEKGIFEDDKGKKYISLLLGLDEPEIHLHPYMQRSLIKYLMNIIANKDLGFMQVISDIFSIDRLLGQIIICTHSPNIILSDYKQIIRFYKDSKGKIVVKNGRDISLRGDVEKHLLKNMPYVKEAFFSKCVILVEGDTELGALPVFAETLNIDLDDHGISIIQAGSAESIPPLMEMLKQFEIKAVGLMDGDKYERYKDVKNLYFTDKKDFEEEIVSFCFEKNEVDILKNIIISHEPKGLRRKIQKGALNQTIKKYNLTMEEVKEDYDFMIDNANFLYPMFLTWLDKNKSIVLGRTIAENIPKELIPLKFKKVIETAVEVSKNV